MCLRKAAVICSGVSAATLASRDSSYFKVRSKRWRTPKQADQGAVLGAAHAALLEPGFLGGGDFVGGETVLERLGEFIAEAGFHFGGVLRIADGEGGEGAAIILGGRAELRIDAVAEAFRIAYAAREARAEAAAAEHVVRHA